ncbi:MAG TPA: hypothetical protein VM074_02105 [Solimonas sp.]|nr:hypothetical protein [Solimonas sp.]
MSKSNPARLVALGAVVLLAACSGGDTAPAESLPFNGRAVLGPLSGATVKVFAVPDFTTPILTTTTRGGSTLAEVGKFLVPPSLLSADALYVIAVRGGNDVDPDDNGRIDGAAAPNAGTLHALVAGREFGTSLHVSLLTELAYRRAGYWLAADYPAAQIAEELDARAAFLLKSDLNSDGAIDRRDLAAWDPATDTRAVRFAPALLASLSSGVRANADQLADMLRLTDPIVNIVPLEAPATSAVASPDALFVFNVGPGPDFQRRLATFSLANPESPTAAGSLATPEPSTDNILPSVCLSGNVLYTYDGAVLHRIDVADLANPRETAHHDTTGLSGSFSHGGLLLVHGALFATDFNNGLQVYDGISLAPLGRGPAGTYGTYEATSAIAASGNFVYVGGGGAVDVWTADPVSPVRLRSVAVPSYLVEFAMVVHDNRLFVTANGGFLIELSLADPANPVVAASYPEIRGFVSVLDGVLLAGTHTLDVTVPGAARVVRKLDPGTFASSNWLVGGPRFMYGIGDDLEVWDASITAPSPFLSLTPTTNFPVDLARNGALYAATEDGFDIFQVMPGSPPVRRGHHAQPSDPNSGANHIGYHDNIVYIAGLDPDTFQGTLHAVDVTDVDAPVELGSTSLPEGRPRDVTVEGSIAYVSTNGPTAVLMVDVSNPASPQTRGSLLTNGLPRTTAVRGTTVYAPAQSSSSGPGNGLQVIDAANPDAPVLSEVIAMPPRTSPTEARIAGNLLFMAVGRLGLRIFDITAPLAPTALGSYDHFDGGFSRFLPDGEFGYGFNFDLTVLDLSDPARPRHLYFLDGDSEAFFDAARFGDRLLTRGNTGIGELRAVVHKLP